MADLAASNLRGAIAEFKASRNKLQSAYNAFLVSVPPPSKSVMDTVALLNEAEDLLDGCFES